MPYKKRGINTFTLIKRNKKIFFGTPYKYLKEIISFSNPLLKKLKIFLFFSE